MSALDEYERVWDMFLETHRQTHGENHVPTRDFNCCGEYAVLMALRAASALKPDYPERLLLRMAAMPELDRDFYVKTSCRRMASRSLRTLSPSASTERAGVITSCG